MFLKATARLPICISSTTARSTSSSQSGAVAQSGSSSTFARSILTFGLAMGPRLSASLRASGSKATSRWGRCVDTYTAWTAATMDALDVLRSVFGTIMVPQSVIDELRTVRDEQEVRAEPSMTVAWHNGEFIRQEHTAEETAARRSYIEEQISRIEPACEVRPVSIPGEPSELAALIYQSFGPHALDAANLADAKHVLVSEDMYFRQYGEAACSTKGAWLQVVFSFALDLGRMRT